MECTGLFREAERPELGAPYRRALTSMKLNLGPKQRMETLKPEDMIGKLQLTCGGKPSAPNIRVIPNIQLPRNRTRP